MASSKASRRVPFLPQAADDEIDPALLDQLPDVAEQPPLPFVLPDGTHWNPDVQEAEPETEVPLDPEAQLEAEPATEAEQADAAAYADPAAADLQTLIDTLYAEAQNALAAQFTRIHQELATRGADVEARLAEALVLNEQLRDENTRLLRQLDHYERAFQTLKALAHDVDGER